MPISDFTVKVSGTVAYANNSHGSFEATATQNGNLGGIVATHSSADSQLHFRELYQDSSAGVDAMLAVLPGTITLTPAAGTAARQVSSFVMEISGVVAFSDRRVRSFVAQWVDGVIDLFPAETDATWTELTAGGVVRSFIQQVLDAVAGVGNSTVSTT
jgi:hypothetical protein